MKEGRPSDTVPIGVVDALLWLGLWKASCTKTQSQFSPLSNNMLCLRDQRVEFAAGTTMGASICWWMGLLLWHPGK